MFPLKPKFRFPKGLSFWKRHDLKNLCKNTNLDLTGYRDIIALFNKVRKEYQLQIFVSFYDGITTFSFEHL